MDKQNLQRLCSQDAFIIPDTDSSPVVSKLSHTNNERRLGTSQYRIGFLFIHKNGDFGGIGGAKPRHADL